MNADDPIFLDEDPRDRDWLRPWVREGYATYEAWREAHAQEDLT